MSFPTALVVLGTLAMQTPPPASLGNQEVELTPIQRTLEHIEQYVVTLRVPRASARGTGFLVRSADGVYIITAHHVVKACEVDEADCLSASSPITKEIRAVVKAVHEERDIAILEVDADLSKHPCAPTVNPGTAKLAPGDEVYLYGKPYLVGGKYPGILRKGVIGSYFDYGDHSLLLADIRTTGGDSGAPVIHIDSGSIIGVNIGNIVRLRRAEVSLRVQVDDHVRDYDLSEEVSGICSVVPYFYVHRLATESDLWSQGEEEESPKTEEAEEDG